MERLRAAARSGALQALTRRYGVSLLVAFGSAVRPEGEPNDLDLAVRFGAELRDVLGFLDALATLAGTDRIDLMDLAGAGPVARERALVGGDCLVEAERGEFARTQLAAMMERMDTDWLRRLDLDLMTG